MFASTMQYVGSSSQDDKRLSGVVMGRFVSACRLTAFTRLAHGSEGAYVARRVALRHCMSRHVKGEQKRMGQLASAKRRSHSPRTSGSIVLVFICLARAAFVIGNVEF